MRLLGSFMVVWLFCQLSLGWMSCTPPLLDFRLEVSKGSGSGAYPEKTVVSIVADLPGVGFKFDRWAGALEFVKDPGAAQTEVTIPAKNIRLEAMFVSTKTPKEYSLEVLNGQGTGLYRVGVEITIIGHFAPAGMSFDRWTGDVEGIVDVARSTTTLVMPARDIRISASYK